MSWTLCCDSQGRVETHPSAEMDNPVAVLMQIRYFRAKNYQNRTRREKDSENKSSLFCLTAGHFTCWISLSPRPKTETKRLSFGLSPMLSLANHSHASSLTSSAIHRGFRRISLFIFWISHKLKWLSLIKT